MMKLFLVLILLAQFSFAQKQQMADKEVIVESDNDGVIAEENFEQIKADRLQRIRREIIEVQSQTFLYKKRLSEEKDSISKLKIESDLEKLESKQKDLRYQFIETISNINLEKKPEQSVKTELSEDVKQIIDPVISGFKKISERPREIQSLQEKIEFYKSRINATKIAKKKLEEYLENSEEKNLEVTINKSIAEANKLKKEYKIALEDAQFKLIKLEQSDESIVTTFSFVILDFIKTKGKNLLLALLVFALIFWGFSLGRDRIITFIMGRITKEVDYPGQIHWVVRPLKVIYALLTFFLALFFSVTTLYVLNDWVLVTLILLLMASLIWSSKHYIPQYFEQLKIIMNLGAIREGERLVYHGLPWKIKSLGYHCRLVNPALSGGYIRISSKELLNHHSRPVGDTEPWFPTRINDWAELNDGTHGKVLMQSPEMIEIKMIGDEHKFMPTSEFLSMTPVNLSQGFAIEFVFGVDYSHQKILFSEVIPNFKQHVFAKLREDFKENQAYFKEYSIEFKAAGASSLDLRFFLKCEGPLASQKKKLERLLNSYFVEVCNKHGYIIPFNQLTVHMQK
jgi:hypothetical protein